MKTRILTLLSLFLGLSLAHAIERVMFEPGPENGGLRLRFSVTPKDGKQGYLASLELLNVSKADITIRADWFHDTQAGDVKDYIESAASIETWPPIAPWMGQIHGQTRTTPQPEEVIKPGGVLSVSWNTDGRQLKARVTNPLDAQNPDLEMPGLYSVHALLTVKTGTGDVRLRSNEQLVKSGASDAAPKHTYGPLHGADAEKKTAQLALGALQKVQVGDQFEVGHPYTGTWKVTITDVWPTYSMGRVEPLIEAKDKSAFPKGGMMATLIRLKAGG